MSEKRQLEQQAQRFRELIKALNTNRLKLSKQIGAVYSQTDSIFNGRVAMSSGYRQKLLKRHPQVNTHWLDTGMGEMFSRELPQSQIMVVEEDDNYLKKYKKPVPTITITDDADLRKTLAKNLNTLSKRWEMKKNELIGVLVPGTKKPTVTNYFSGSSQLPLGGLVRLEELTGIGLSTWVTREIQMIELPFEPLNTERIGGFEQLQVVKESLQALLRRLG